MQLARALKSEAEFANERRLLVLTGSPDATREAAADALGTAGVGAERVTYVGTAEATDWEQVGPRSVTDLLGTTREAVVLDCHEECRPNALGQVAGTVDGGGLLLVLAPPLDAWPERRDAFDETLAVPPFDVDDVGSNFRRRLVSLLRAHPGIAVVDADSGEVCCDGLTDPAPRRPPAPPSAPPDRRFPEFVYDRTRTQDQADAVAAFERFLPADDAAPGGDATPDSQALVVEADRGRGKSSAAGLAAAALALAGRDVLVTAPNYRNAAEVFARVLDALAERDAIADRDGREEPHWVETADGGVRFAPPPEAATLPDAPDVVVVDESAALPVRLLERFLDAERVAFATTVHGYEGAGRGFSVRFRDRLAESDHAVTDVSLAEPIRYAAGDPVEVWAFRALLLDAGPPADPLVAGATPESVTYERVAADDLLADEHLLREVFGLLVLAHYRTEPNDLARLFDAPNVSVRALLHEGHVVSVALLAREGDLPADLRASMYEGERVRGNMIPDVLTSQLRDENAGVPAGMRVLRIATHHAARSRGLGSALLDAIRAEFADEVDWLGTGYGATPDLVRFWAANGFRTVHLSTRRNETSGEHSVVMLDPTSDAGQRLHDRHAAWFLDRIGGMLTDPLDDVDPDVVASALGSVAATPDLDLSGWEWRLLAGLPHGTSIFDTSPRPLRRLTLRYLVDTDGGVVLGESGEGADAADERSDLLTARQQRLLVRKALQGQSWGTVTEALDYPGHAACMRALGSAVRPLLSRYGPPIVERETERFE